MRVMKNRQIQRTMDLPFHLSSPSDNCWKEVLYFKVVGSYTESLVAKCTGSRVQSLAMTLSRCTTLGKFLSFSESHYCHT